MIIAECLGNDGYDSLNATIAVDTITKETDLHVLLFMFSMNEFFRFGINMEDVDKHFPEESGDMN